MAPRLLLAAAVLILLGILAPVQAQEMRFFRIGTGGVAGTYNPIGGLIADIISSPPGARPCDKGGSCGVPGLVTIAQSSNGPVANLASRLCDEAADGEILVSPRVLNALDGLAIAEPAGELVLKGFARPVAARRIAGLAAG